MPFSIAVDHARRVVRVTVTGIFEVPEAAVMTTEARKLAAQTGLPVLYDIRGATAGRLESTDIFWMPRTIPALKEPAAARVRVATLHDASQRPLVHFWETAFRNAGLNVRAFEGEEAALAWLES